jgi:lysyl-tRNA synthetase class 2
MLNMEKMKKEKIVDELRRKGVEPYPHVWEVTHSISDVLNNAQKLMKTAQIIQVAGRVMAKRLHGKACFMDLLDEGKKIQVYLKYDELGEEKYRIVKDYIWRGDIVGVRGYLFYTQKGELTIYAKDFKLLSKALRPLPHQWYGLRDVETRYRKRYLDMMLNPEVRWRVLIRSEIIWCIRKYLRERGFVEVETPTLQPVYGGAYAKPFLTYVNALREEWYLRISPELYLKRYIIAGFNKVFEICKDFRNEDIDAHHNPEFTMIEIYQAYADYRTMMELTEGLISSVAEEVLGTLKVKYKGKEVDLTPPFRRIRMYDALNEYAGINVSGLSDEEIKRLLDEKGIKVRGGYNRGLAIAELFEATCEGHLWQPTFVMDYPKETTPLCKLHRENPDLIERFELYIAGMELANAYSELNDPVLQRQFFEEELKRKKMGNEEAHPYDEEFVEALEYGMPSTGGVGIGIDRLVMILTGAESIKEVIPFPMVKREENG